MLTAVAAQATAAAVAAPAKAAGGILDSLYGDAGVKSARPGLAQLFPPTFRTALNALRRNTMRSVLDRLGIIMGVGAVITMTEIGQGTNAVVAKTIASMGANRLLLLPGAADYAAASASASARADHLTPLDGDEILRQCPAVANVAPIVRARASHLRQPQLGSQ